MSIFKHYIFQASLRFRIQLDPDLLDTIRDKRILIRIQLDPDLLSTIRTKGF